MPSLFYGINLALRAVLSHQQAIEVTQHNVANANTPGYRRQQAVLVAGLPYAPPTLMRELAAGQMGGGVRVDRIQRFNLEFFDGRYRRELAEATRWQAERDVLQQVESTLAESTPDGLLPKLDEFWAGWQALSADPTNTALRGDLRERSSALAQALNRRAGALAALRVDQDLAIRQRVDEINAAASQIARLNVEIARVLGVGDQPNDLMDERDRMLDKLATLAGAESHLQPNGEAIVSINGHALVVGRTTFQVSAVPDAANANLARLVWQDGQAFSAPRGELKGLFDARDRVIPDQQNGLDSFAATLINQVNALHRAGFGLNGATNLDFFAGTDALSMRLDAAITDPVNGIVNIATAAAAGNPGDGNVARQIFDLQQALLMNGGTATLNQFYTAQVGRLGLEGRSATAAAEDRGLVAESLDRQRESIGGVSLDEEAANLVQSQRAYEAAARMMTTIDEMIDRVINGMGRVGL